MSDLYPYCSKCDNELTEEEKEMNKKYQNVFYPICESCLKLHVDKLIELGNKEE